MANTKNTDLGTIEMDTRTYAVREVRHRVFDIYRAGQTNQDPIGRGWYGDGGRADFKWAVIGDGSGSWIAEFKTKFVDLVEAYLAE